jgi:hypothetical protein
MPHRLPAALSDGKRAGTEDPATASQDRTSFCGECAMRHVIAAIGTAALLLVAAPAVRASSLDAAVQSLAEHEVAYAKKGGWHGRGKGWKHSWKRGGPPPWAPAWGYRRKHRW